MTETQGSERIREKACSVCRQPFLCGPGSSDVVGGCWCEELPPLMTLISSANCLCPNCLREAVSSQQPAG